MQPTIQLTVDYGASAQYQAALQLPQVSSYRQWAVLTNLPQYLNPSQEVCSQVRLGFSHWSADVITLAVNF